MSSNHKGKQPIFTNKFNGSGSIENFLMKFNIVAGYNKWDENDRMTHLQLSLEGEASQILFESRYDL